MEDILILATRKTDIEIYFYSLIIFNRRTSPFTVHLFMSIYYAKYCGDGGKGRAVKKNAVEGKNEE